MLRCCARSRGQLYTHTAGGASPPASSGIVVSGILLSCSWAGPSSRAQELSGGFEQAAKEEGEGEKKKRSLMGQQEAQLPGRPPHSPRAVYLQSPGRALADDPSCFGCQQDQCSSYLWLTQKGTRGRCSR